MNRKTFLKILIASLFLILLAPSLAEAICTPGESQLFPCGSPYNQSRCEANNVCGADINREFCVRRQRCYCVDDGSGGYWWTNCDSCYSSCSNLGSIPCEDWDMCVGSTSWQTYLTSPSQTCSCAGECLADPVRAGNTTYPNSGIRDGLGFVDPNNVFLPGTFDWQSVSGANSYWWKADLLLGGTGTTSMITQLGPSTITASEYTPDSCSLQSGQNYEWAVRPCCNANGTNCRSWGGLPVWDFTTNLAPEPISPPDPDWNNSALQATSSIPVTLDWCDPPDNKDYLGSKDDGKYLYDEGRGIYVNHYRLLVHVLDSAGNETVWLSRDLIKELSPPFDKLLSSFQDYTGYYLTENKEYRWQVATCYHKEGETICTDYSQKWEFSVGNLDYELNLQSPQNSTVDLVELPLKLIWNEPIGINSFKYQIRRGGSGGPLVVTGTTKSSQVTMGYSDLDLDTIYSWRVQPCTDHEALTCKDWSDYWQFKTTGVPPNTISPPSGATDQVLPVALQWENVQGAKSYKYKVMQGGTTIKEGVIKSPLTLASVGYPDLKMNSSYSWQVQTCADEKGNVCGTPSPLKTFTTFEMEAPVLVSPLDGSTIKGATRVDFEWNDLLGAKAYEYKIQLKDGATEPIIIHKIITSNSASHITAEFPETGLYNWQVRGCLDLNCDDIDGTGDWTTWEVNLDLIAPPDKQGGLVPCGRSLDDPNTPWNERESCQIHHFFLLIRNVIEFALWKVATILLILSLIVMAALLYVSAGDKDTIFKIKSLVRSVIIGYLLILFAWLIINFILALAGFNFQLFGNWWELKF